MLFKIAINNVKKNYKNYITYFLSVSFAVMMIYLFLAIFYNPQVNASLGNDKKFMIVFNIASALSILFSAFFIWYSNSFFIRTRKKELATYMLLGMNKFEVSILVFIENIIIAVASFAVGIFLGVLFCKFFIMILVALMGVSVNIKFRFEYKAFFTTVRDFSIIFIIIAIHSGALVYRNNLIDLFNAAKRREKAPKVSVVTALLSIISIISIVYGYYLALTKGSKFTDFLVYPEFMVLIVVGTIILFYSAIIFFIHLQRKKKSSYYKGTNLISTTQLLYRYNGNAGSLAVISILSAITLTAMCFTYSSYAKSVEAARENVPFSLQYTRGDAKLDDKIQSIIESHKEISIKSKDDIKILVVNSKYDIYKDTWQEYVLSESQYNSIAEHENNSEKVHLNSAKDAFVVELNVNKTEALKNSGVMVQTGSYKQSFKVKDSTTKFYMALNTLEETIVVKDSVFNQLEKNTSEKNIINVRGYMINNEMKSNSLVKELGKIIPKQNMFFSYYENYEGVLKVTAVMLFVGIFLGMLFLLATGSIIYFKQVVEASEDKYRYNTLTKIGLSKKEIKYAVMKQLMIIFGLPLLVSVGHSYTASQLFGQMFHESLNTQYFIVLVVYIVLYIVYYFITVKSYTKIVTQG
jgi:putative ABC transport system permease protein